MAAYSPDPIGPGEVDSPQPMDQSTVDAVNSAVNQGYSYADVVAYHADAGLPQPPQPSLDAIMSGNTSDASQWSQPSPFIDTGVDPHVDAINEGAGPIGDALILGAAGAAVGVVAGAAEGIGEGVLSDIAGAQINPLSRAAQMGVETTTEGLLGRMTPAGLAAERAAAVADTVAAKAKIPLAAGAAAVTMTGNRTLSLDDDLFKGTPAPRRPRGPENSGNERTI